jgi:hypothetical protein
VLTVKEASPLREELSRRNFLEVSATGLTAMASPAGQIGPRISSTKTLSMYAANPAYFQSADRKPLVMIGDYEASPSKML